MISQDKTNNLVKSWRWRICQIKLLFFPTLTKTWIYLCRWHLQRGQTVFIRRILCSLGASLKFWSGLLLGYFLDSHKAWMTNQLIDLNRLKTIITILLTGINLAESKLFFFFYWIWLLLNIGCVVSQTDAYCNAHDDIYPFTFIMFLDVVSGIKLSIIFRHTSHIFPFPLLFKY